MMKSVFRLGIIALAITAIAGLPLQVAAQTTTTNKPPVEKKATSDKKESTKKGTGPFHGTLGAVDKVAKTITVGKRTFQITSGTKINKGGKPATLEDGVVGEEVAGYFKTAEDGKLNATSVRFGAKPGATTGEKKADAAKAAK